jgi:hypothetical protein
MLCYAMLATLYNAMLDLLMIIGFAKKEAYLSAQLSSAQSRTDQIGVPREEFGVSVQVYGCVWV